MQQTQSEQSRLINWLPLKNALEDSVNTYLDQPGLNDEKRAYAKRIQSLLQRADIQAINKNSKPSVETQAILTAVYANINANFTSRLAAYCCVNAITYGVFPSSNMRKTIKNSHSVIDAMIDSIIPELENAAKNDLKNSTVGYKRLVSNVDAALEKSYVPKGISSIEKGEEKQPYKPSARKLLDAINTGCDNYKRNVLTTKSLFFPRGKKESVRVAKLQLYANTVSDKPDSKHLLTLLKALSETGSDKLFSLVMREAIFSGALPTISSRNVNSVNSFTKLFDHETERLSKYTKEDVSTLADNLNDMDLMNNYYEAPKATQGIEPIK